MLGFVPKVVNKKPKEILIVFSLFARGTLDILVRTYGYNEEG